MADLQDSIVIARPVEEVFSFASNLENATKVMENVVAIEKLTEGPIQVGSQFKETREIRGRKASYVMEFTEFESNKRYSVKSESNGLTVVYHYDFKPTVEGGTKINFHGDIHTSGFMMKLTKPIIRRILKKEDADHLPQLKRLLEGTAEPSEIK
ncbi:Polyketide cyclase / dehydrase and lipid transport [Bacillus sp. THAF10]|uniref:SRPBCC family protein n=1 Tax=Bacillus sp. THAF10 TaxID=2587848 RepID=UPI001268C01A|nr:SRPBCC family protein [Bacillus sp. THAF10]QFT91004.1 Polyketide cyclase / dehydrase and lipid transport [Bacillus sp. THAF10]